jgi:hypothetical protein
VLDEAQLLVGEGIDRVRTHRFEHRGDVQSTVTDPPWENRAAIEEHAGQVQPSRCHEHAGERFVAPGQGHHAIEALGVHHRLHRVSDDLAADQRRTHALMTHGDAIGHRDGHEFEGKAARIAHAGLRPLGQASQGKIARGDFVPR